MFLSYISWIDLLFTFDSRFQLLFNIHYISLHLHVKGIEKISCEPKPHMEYMRVGIPIYYRKNYIIALNKGLSQIGVYLDV